MAVWLVDVALQLGRTNGCFSPFSHLIAPSDSRSAGSPKEVSWSIPATALVCLNCAALSATWS